eukprot:COSAG04_NODE_1562_length_6335_cov_34.922226_2_plen_476_part_00
MKDRGLSGDPEAAQKHWGSCSSKLETVLLVAVPSESGGRNSARILPGREDVYIIPRADCVDGLDGNFYYSNRNIQACLVLKPLASAGDLDRATAGRVQCNTEYDEKGMAQLQLSPISDFEVVVDVNVSEMQFEPKITQFSMTMAQPVAEDSVRLVHHSAQQPTFLSQQLWLEDVARFKALEMEAGIVGVDQLLTQAYTLAYYFTTIESAMQICDPGSGIPAVSGSGEHSITVCLWPPSKLGWQPNASGHFRDRVAELMDMDADDVQAMVILGLPSSLIVGGLDPAVLKLSEPAGDLACFKLADDLISELVIYSNAHIAKVWTLESTALADARQALVNIRAGEKLKDDFEGKTVDDMEMEVQLLEEKFQQLRKEDVGRMDPVEMPAIEPQPEPTPHVPVAPNGAEDEDGLLDDARRQLQQARAKLAQCQVDSAKIVLAANTVFAAKDEELARLRAQVADASSYSYGTAEGVPPAQQ